MKYLKLLLKQLSIVLFFMFFVFSCSNDDVNIEENDMEQGEDNSGGENIDNEDDIDGGDDDDEVNEEDGGDDDDGGGDDDGNDNGNGNEGDDGGDDDGNDNGCLLYTSPSPRDRQKSRMPSSA